MQIGMIAGFGLLTGALCLMGMASTPGRGVMKGLERLFVGIVLCYLCGLLLAPFGVPVSGGPLSALLAGCLGMPGAALGAFVQGGW